MKHRTPFGQSGFTLIEVLVALAIVSIGIVATSKTIVSSVDVTQYTQDRVMGTWVASNRLSEIRLSNRFETPLVGGSSLEVVMGGRTWLVNENISETGVEDAVRIEIEVFADKTATERVASLFSYMVKQTPKAPEPEDGQNGDPNNPGTGNDG